MFVKLKARLVCFHLARKLSYVISSCFGHQQNCLEFQGNLKIEVYYDKETLKIKIIINHKGTCKDNGGWRRLTQITNYELEKFKLNFSELSSCAKRDLDPLTGLGSR